MPYSKKLFTCEICGKEFWSTQKTQRTCGQYECRSRVMRKNITWVVDPMTGCYLCTSHALDRQGYPVTTKKGKFMRMNRYIFEKEYGSILPGMIIRHSCDNPTCINPSHLLLGTIEENIQDRVQRNRTARGEKANKSHLTDERVRSIYLDTTRSISKIASEEGVSEITVKRIIYGMLWTHVTQPLGPAPRLSLNMRSISNSGMNQWFCKLTDDQVMEILQYKTTLYKDLAKKYNVTEAFVGAIKTGEMFTKDSCNL